MSKLTLHRDQLEGSRVFSTFMREYANLIDAGQASPYTQHHKEYQVVYAVSPEDKVLGLMVYTCNHQNKVGWRLFSWTDPTARKQGVYSALTEEVVVQMKAVGMKSMQAMAHVDNEISIKANKSVGMLPEYIRVRRDF